MPVCLDMLQRPVPGGWGGGLFRGLALMGLIRGLGCEIGFGSASGSCLVWRPAGHSPGIAGFRRFRIDMDCASLPDRLSPWTDSEIGHRDRIRAKENTGIDVCPTVRLIGDNQRTLVFRRFRLGAGGGYSQQ